MKKTFILMTILSVLLMTTACTNSTMEDDTQNPVSNQDINQKTQVGATSSSADISGEIFEIIGNQITLRIVAGSDENETKKDWVPGSGKGKTGGTIERIFTDETLELLIPVGTSITTRVPQSGNGSGTGTGPTEKAIGLEGIVKGSFLKIYYMSDGITIEKIVVQPPRG